MILLKSHVYSTTNTQDTIETFIAETMYNLLLPNLMCYSTGCLCPCNCSAYCTRMTAVLYCTVPYIAARLDVSWNGIFWDRSSLFSKIYMLQVCFYFLHFKLEPCLRISKYLRTNFSFTTSLQEVKHLIIMYVSSPC